MFATLDPTIRAIRLPSRRRVLCSDTVGFVRDLPPGLIAAFRATLEEVQEAALLVHVTDASNPRHAEQDAEVLKVLASLNVLDRPRVHVMNKIDRLSEEEVSALRGSNGRGNAVVPTSAVTREGLQELLVRIDEGMALDPLVRLRLRLPVSDGRHFSQVQAHGRVLHSQIVDGHLLLDAEVPQSVARGLQHLAIGQQPQG
jgi:GTP-binding protein HflX